MAGSIVESVMSLLGPNVAGPIASQLGESAENVQRGVTEVIGRMQAWKREAVDLPSDSAIPKLIDAIRAKPHEVFIPEAEMKFESDWHLGIEDVQAGRPRDVWHHRGQLII